MSLPSQRRSFGPRVSAKSRRGPGGTKLIGGAVLAATLIGGGWLLFAGGDTEPQVFEPGSDLLAPMGSDPASGSLSGSAEGGSMLDASEFESSGVIASRPAITVRPGIDLSDRGDAAPGSGSESGAGGTDVATLGGGSGRPSAALVSRSADRESTRQTPTAPRSVPAATVRAPSSVGVATLVSEARSLLGEERLVAARDRLNEALKHPEATEQDRAMIRGDMAVLNEDLFFGSKVYEGDPLAFKYTIEPGDRLAAIAANKGLGVDWRLIQRINRISSPSRIRVGQELKLVQGPMHAVVTKSAYRLDLYAGPPGAPEQWMYIRSFSVGLGEDNSTPLGRFVVRPQSKLINPTWRNPRTGEFFGADNPENPIGERWVGLEGTGDAAGEEGMGIHGTIEPGSIGRDASMGCVRLVDGDVDVVYECLEEQISEVLIRP
ncbi:MAG: L,D-transpeptidase family protein [Planctomycetota bacterium]